MARMNNLPVLFFILRGIGPLLFTLNFGRILREIFGLWFGGFTKSSLRMTFIKKRMSSTLKQSSSSILIEIMRRLALCRILNRKVVKEDDVCPWLRIY